MWGISNIVQLNPHLVALTRREDPQVQPINGQGNSVQTHQFLR